MNLDNITKQDIQSCRKALILCQEAKEAIERAKACNVDCSDQEQMVLLAEDTLKKMHQLYGPQYPVKGA